MDEARAMDESYYSRIQARPKYNYLDRDLQLPVQIHQNVQSYRDSPDEGECICSCYGQSKSTFHSFSEISIRKYLGNSISMVSLISENLLCHPFVVLRRQCQVHHNSVRYHLVPITLMPVVYHIQRRQGITTLWKGIGGSFLVRAMSLGVEDLISKVTPWPKELNPHTTKKQFAQHLFLKCISLAVVMPFYSASLVETVQSDIASEKPGFLDVFREGGLRLLYWSAPQKGRMLPVWVLIGPGIALGMSKYIFG